MNDAPKRLHLGKDGLEAFFGELEAKVMRRLWEHQPCSVLCVKEALENERSYSYNTVMTVLTRLVEKGWVRKRRKGKTTLYVAAEEKDVFLRKAAQAVLAVFLGRKAVFSTAHFVGALEGFPEEDVRELKRLIGRA